MDGRTKSKGKESGLRRFSIFNFQYSILPAALFVVLGLCAIWGFLAIFPPKPYEPPVEAFTEYSRASMLEAVSPTNVRARLDEIAALGDRFIGKPGFYATEAMIRKAYVDAGLQVLEQEVPVVAPQTQVAEAVIADGQPVSFRIYPFMPNYYQPIATPDAGVTGTLIEVTDEVLKTRTSFEGCFALIDGSVNAPLGYGYDFTKYAQLGFEGVVIANRDGLDAMLWSVANQMSTVSPVNYLRLAADREVFNYVGREVTVRVRVRYSEVPTRTVVGILKGDAPRREALVIPCSYDALSILPDRSPGIIQAGQVATHLQIMRGLASHRETLRRDVIFVAFGGRFMAHAAQDRFVAAIGSQAERGARRRAMQSQQDEHNRRLALIADCAPFLLALSGQEPRIHVLAAQDALEEEARRLFDEQLQYVLNTLVFERSEEMLQAKIQFEKGDTTDLESAEFLAYQASRKVYDKAFSCAGLRLVRLLDDQADFVSEVDLFRRLESRFEELRVYHEMQVRLLNEGLAINAALADYGQMIVMAQELIPRDPARKDPEALTFTMGAGINHSSGGGPARQELQAAVQEQGLAGSVGVYYSARRNYGGVVGGVLAGQGTEAETWAKVGYPAYSVISHGRSYSEFAYPSEKPWMRAIETLEASLKTVGATLLSVAYGNGEFKTISFSSANVHSVKGSVYVANVGQSIIPNYPLAGALVGCATRMSPLLSLGYMRQLLLMSDVYGRYGRDYCLSRFANSYDYSPEAVGYGADGTIRFVKDQGPKAQRIYKSMNLGGESLANEVNIVCYRADSVTILDLINPQSMKNYAGARFVRTRGLNEFDSTFLTPNAGGVLTDFIKPDEYFFVELKAGSAENELVQTTRAFMLGSESEDGVEEIPIQRAARPGSEIRGRGYLAAETPFIRDVAGETALSMIRVNSQRLRVQDHYGMADDLTREFQQRAEACLASATGDDISRRDATLEARDAVTYSTLNHPVLRENIFEAVAGILWYLGLLVPFTFFFEKLVFGYPDIRKQLGAHVVIFLSVFLLLKLLHPAFVLIRSSLMILLGFIILLISGGILAMFSSKFKENLESIKKARGQVTAAEVNKAGAIVTAFMLGLNNMHRRRVRTMLTCGTLVLITFVMICFTSVQSDITETSKGIGKAPFSGFVVKNEEYRPVAGSEVFALQTKYGDRYAIAPRMALMGREDWDTRERLYPELRLVSRDGSTVREAVAKSVLQFTDEEPLAPELGIRGRWFTEGDVLNLGENPPVIISRTMAESLGLPVEDVESGEEVSVEINGETFPVCGVFEGRVLDNLLDLDGENLLPFDIKALRDLVRLDYRIIASEDDPRLPGDSVIIAPRNLGVQIPNADVRVVSVAVVFPEDLPPRDGREEIRQYMEQSGRLTYFGLDGFSFLGKRAREGTFVGLVDMLIPLIIAAITVLNTIRGSVYERKEEIFVYNAVGIAPKHIFFMFFAEAFVYAVVGSVLGYILSQGTGRLLTAIDLTGGLNMTFTSLGTIYASLTIAASVFVSTWFPARTAMKIASPSEDLGWRLPEPDGDALRFRLPFTFDWHDRIAVLAFFRRFFIDHGEGSSGPFFAGPPDMGLAGETDPLNDDGYIPTITVPTWLKPFDLGVSQELQIAMPTDSETGEFVADITLTRQSGTLENWKRLNHVFVGLLRKHFLHWRAVGQEERAGMFKEAREELNIQF
jgi:hypothetical protein